MKPADLERARARALLKRGAELVAAGHAPDAVAASIGRLAFAKAAPKFDAAQEAVEDLGTAAMRAAGQPIDPAAIRRAIRQATDAGDLVERLAVLFDTMPSADYREAMERALFAADVLGYAHTAQGASGADPEA